MKGAVDMAVAITRPTGVKDRVEGNKDRRVRTLTFSGNYATGGESVAATDVGLKFLEEVVVHGGVAAASDVATAIPVYFNYSTNKFVFYEGSAAGTALSEKTNAEAYPTGCNLRATFIGF